MESPNSTPQGGIGTGGTRGAQGVGGIGGTSRVGGTTGASGALGANNPNGIGTEGSPGWYEIKLPTELPAGNYWLRLQDRAQIHRMVVVRE